MDDDVINLGDTTGIVVSFYELLWRKKNDRQEKQCKYPGFYVHLPDTIVYNFSQPQYWYFTSLHYGCINKKKRHNMNSKNILEKFLRCRSKSGIVAGYMWNDDSPEGRSRVRDGGSPISMRYFDAEDLKSNLLRLGQYNGNGILQQFIDPKTAVDGSVHNSMIQASWQPNHVQFERRQNKHSLTDSRLSYQKRAETFEGTFENSESFPLVSPILLQEITHICNGIAEHLWHVAECAVKSMVLNFKVDESNKIWLLFCSQISVIGRDTVPRPVNDLLQSYTSKGANGMKKAREREENAEAPRSPLLKPGSGPELGDTQSQLQSMLARIPNMRVENSAQTMARPIIQLREKRLEPHSQSPPTSPKERRPPKPAPPARETFSDLTWGTSAEAIKRIIFAPTVELSASQW